MINIRSSQSPPIVRSTTELRALAGAWRAADQRVALVPTMGALHEGHLSLLHLARRQASKVIVSLFVNPAQFGPGEDFQSYPRDEARDAQILAAVGCDLLYAPSPAAIYPPGFATTVTVGGLTDFMEGAARPGHFSGVTTVVAKLIIQCAPDVAVFGEKDYQQLQVIRRLAVDLDLPVEITAGPIARDPDGLALSSRNAYLTPQQRTIAPMLNRALQVAASAMAVGVPAPVAEADARRILEVAGFDAVDYIEARSADTLERLAGVVSVPARLLAAARLGRVRLLDNAPI
jgi:pantoate--beta-alanine ligase